jgi:phenylalanyl-tRNA synthetase beta subunit
MVYNTDDFMVEEKGKMDQFVEESLQIAAEKFKAFGFKEAQIEKLLASARQDLEKEIGRLRELLGCHEPDTEKVNQVLHALKGLLYNMGNTEAGDLMSDLKNGSDGVGQIEAIKKILHL